MIRQLAYTSVASTRVSELMLDEIGAGARRFNAAHGISGMLICEGRRFMQVIEGDGDAVASCMARIEADRRHRKIMRMFEWSTVERSFPDWAMETRHIGQDDDSDTFVARVKADVARVPDARLQAFMIGFARLGGR